ncbi:MAG: type VI secretion system contractile sheath small subunit [Holosporales bacterium]|jgi:type VI secretion system protein ImpB|nr:type VI secretion system contractile sheath small subunit [Holosporales bacterium]
MSESTQHTLDRVRPPRVQITYDVEIGGAIQMKELPFLVGILADLSGKQTAPLPRFKERKFAEIDRDNFDEILASIKPRLAFEVNNKLQPTAQQMGVELFFSSMDDFNPLAVVKSIPALNALYGSRVVLRDILAKMEGNDALMVLLEALLANKSLRDAVRQQITARTQSPTAAGNTSKKQGGPPQEQAHAPDTK